MALGLRSSGRYWDLVDLKICYLMKKDLIQTLLELFKDYGRRSCFQDMTPEKEGVLRNLLVRYSASQELLIGLSTTDVDLPARKI